MPTKPNPVALTACMLLDRLITGNRDRQRLASLHSIADLASQLHRLAPACKRLAEAECNGEWWDGQRDSCRPCQFKSLDDSIRKYAARLDKRVAKLNAALAPFAVSACRTGDPRGWTLRLRSTDLARPLPSNGWWSDAEWGIG